MPGGSWCEHVNESDKSPAILFVASDEPTLKALALYQKHGKTKTGEIVKLAERTAARHSSRTSIMAKRRNTKQLAHFDCPGGGQVWVEGTTLYVGHMRQPTGTTHRRRRRSAESRSCSPRSRCPQGWHSHKVRVANDIMIVNHERQGTGGRSRRSAAVSASTTCRSRASRS